MSGEVIVLKLGGSVLVSEDALAQAVHEVYRFLRDGRRVVAVVSALGETTDALLERARRWSASPEATAALVATGEAQSAALLALALDRAGVPAAVLDVDRIGLRATGPVHAATPVAVSADALRGALRDHAAVVVPGFVARDESGRLVLLGRGGSDLSAVFIASELGAPVRLVKDVPGLFERDPALPGLPPRRFRTLSHDDALRLDGRVLQHAAVRLAAERGVELEIGALNGGSATRVRAGAEPTFFDDSEPARPLRVALLGLGTVGLGAWQALAALPRAFTVVRCLVRRPRPYLDLGVPPELLTISPADILDAAPDIVVDALCGADASRAIVAQALERGIDVVSANKECLVAHGVALEAIARRSGARLLASASVGGGVPVLETLRAAGPGSVARVEAVLNGTSTFVLDELARGRALSEAVGRAQVAGLAELDPTDDLDGTDAARKVVLLARAAFGAEIAVEDVEREGIAGIPVGAGETWRLVATLERGRAKVAPRRLDAGDPLGSVSGEGNVFLVWLETDLAPGILRGKGAGRWPTAEAIVGDLLELARLPVRERLGLALAAGARA